MKISIIVEDFKAELLKHKFDIVHGLLHHYDVWRNCLDIIEKEKLTNFDLSSLMIATWAHDLESYLPDNNNFKILKGVLDKHKVDKKLIEKVTKIIEEHSFTAKQTLLESKILFDADKLDYISIYRWSNTLAQVKDGLLNERFEMYEKKCNKLFPLLREKLHFEFSRKKFDKDKIRFDKFVKKHKLIKDGKMNFDYYR